MRDEPEQEMPGGAQPAPGEPRWLLFVRLAGVLVAVAVIAAAVLLLRRSQPSQHPARAAASPVAATTAAIPGAPAAFDPAAVSPATGPLGSLESGAPIRGQPAPNFALQDLDGHRVELNSLRGKVVVVNFWATWCGPCRQEFPELQKAASSMNGDVVILGLDQAESAARVSQFRDQFNTTFTLLLDDKNAVADSYRLSGIPDTIFIDRGGVVRDIVFGPLSAGSFRYKIAQVLGTQ